MAFIRNAWYLACWSKDIKSGEMFNRRLLNEQIVFYRKQDGTPIALQDKCPHRFVPLSMGVLANDKIMCQYHGLTFDCTGKCVDNPHGDGKIPAAAKVQAYPLEERLGMVWIWMGNGPADLAKVPTYEILQQTEGFSTSHGYLHIEANYELMAENLLDLSHITYLHDGYLGSPEQRGADQTLEEGEGTITCNRWMPNISVPKIFDMVYRRDGKNVDMWTNMKWVAPSNFMLDTGVHEVNGKREDYGWYYGVHILTPDTEKTTHYHFAAIMPPGTKLTETEAQEFSALRRLAFQEQDKPFLDAQQAAIGDRDFWDMKPVLLTVDAGPIRMRRQLEKMIKEEQESN
jgi:phenylpropionate dioxygenase-like ring-hydroxylating dioxygenase large terminal subunit